uniref:Uncharacterized protein n=1 Tax=Anguilla anguilla TaxID=7936 RepID=A0A0E9QYY1_ANGAN
MCPCSLPLSTDSGARPMGTSMAAGSRSPHGGTSTKAYTSSF